jgi:hypothetical protein
MNDGDEIAVDSRGARWLAEDTCPGSWSSISAEADALAIGWVECACNKKWLAPDGRFHRPFTIRPHPRGLYLPPAA